MGQTRADLTNEDVRVWVVHRYLIVYRATSEPIEIVRVLHGARDPRELKRKVGE